METATNATLDQWTDFGITDMENGQFAAAENWFRAILRLSPYHFDGQQLLGLALVRQGRLAEGIEALALALQIRPRATDVLSNLAEAQREAGNLEAQIQTLERLGTLDSTEAPRIRLVTALAHAGQTERAVRLAVELFQAYPASPATATLLAQLLRSLGRHSHALLAYRSALELTPQEAELHFDVGDLFVVEGDPAAAAACFERALALGGADLRRGSTLGLAVAELDRCAWTRWGEWCAELDRPLTGRERGLNAFLPLLIPMRPQSLVALTREGTRQWVNDGLRARPSPLAPLAGRHDTATLRLAFVSPDFRDHPVGRIAAAVLAQLRQRGHYVLGVSLTGQPDTLTDRIRQAVSGWVDGATLNDAAIAQAMHAHDIDVVVDLAGPTAGARPGIFRHQPGRARASWLGYPGSASHPDVPYLVSDRSALPDELAQWFGETVVRLAIPAITVDGWVGTDRASARAALGVADGDLVIGSWARWRKINPTLFWQWIAALEQVPEAVLLLKRPSAEAGARLLSALEGRTFRPGQLRLVDPAPDYAAYLDRFSALDLALDTYPYGSHSMALDSLRVGTPLLSVRGALLQSRIGAGLVAALGMDDFVVDDVDRYADRLIAHLRDPAALAGARETIRERAPSQAMLRPELLALHLERGLRMILDHAASGAGRQLLDVPAP